MRIPLLMLTSILLGHPALSASSSIPGIPYCEARTASGNLIGAAPVLRITDRALGQLWEIRKDCEHPAGPGRIVSVGVATTPFRSQISGSSVLKERRVINIHAGDRITLVQETPTMHVTLQAISLEDGPVGARIRVRLLRGQTVLSASVLSFGRATLMPLLEPSFQESRERLP